MRGDLAVLVERPAVVRAHEAVVLDGAGRQRGAAVRAAVGGDEHVVAQPGHHHRRPVDLDPLRLGADVGARAEVVPGGVVASFAWTE